MIRTQLYIPDDLYAQAKAMAALKRMNILQYVRESLAEHIASERKTPKGKKKKGTQKRYDPLGRLVGKYSVGKGITTDVARNHNDIYDL